MTTIERPPTENRTSDRPRERAPRHGVLIVLGMVLALVVGGLAGYLIRGDDGESVGSVVAAGETELTARHEEMAALMADYEQAWLAGDGAAAEAVFAPGGTLTALGETYEADAGGIADFIGRQRWTALDIHEPMLVDGHTALSFHSYDGLRSNLITFTADGEVKIVSHVISDPVSG